MSTALAKPEELAGRFLALNPSGEAAEALAANLAGGESIGPSDLLYVPMPTAGATKWRIPELSGDEYVEEIVGLLVYYGMSGVLWPTPEFKPGSVPVLRTTDLIHAERVGDDLGDIDEEDLEACRIEGTTYDWRALPWNQWGTGKGGIGKRCKESRVLCILRENDLFPLLIRAQAGSLKTVAPFVKRLTQVPVPHYRAVVGLKLQKAESKGGQPFAQIVPRLVGTVDAGTGSRIHAMYTAPLRDAIRRDYTIDAASNGEQFDD